MILLVNFILLIVSGSKIDSLPYGWAEAVTNQTHNIYYLNHVTRTVQWSHPMYRKANPSPQDTPSSR